jgi:predicted MFS family arabinose efflux permease
LASTIGGLPFNVLPVMLGSLADSFKLDAQTTGMIGSVCFAGYLVGTLGAPFWMNRVNWRLLTIVSAIGTAASFAASSQIDTLEWLVVVWALIGFFASTMTCLGMRILSDLPDKVRAFGTRQGVELTVTAAVLFALPPLIISHYQYPGAALSLAAVVAILGLSAFWVPTGAQSNQDAAAQGTPATGAHLPAMAWQSLALFFVFLVGNIGLWAFLERIGSSLQIAPAEMGIVFAVLKLLGGVAAFFTAAVGERVGPTRAAWWVLGTVGLGLVLLQTASAFIGFALGAWIWEFAFTCGCVFHAASIARSDPSGRAVMLVPAVFALSSMEGPGLAGQIVAGGNYVGLLAFALASTLLPALVNLFRRPA